VQETKTQYIAEMELCLDKTFQLMECPRKLPQQPQLVSSYERNGVAVRMIQRMQDEMSVSGESERCADTRPVAYPVIHYH